MNRIPALKLPNLTAEVLSTGVDIAVKKGALLSLEELFALNSWCQQALHANADYFKPVAEMLANPQRYGLNDGIVVIGSPVDVPTGTQDHFELYP